MRTAETIEAKPVIRFPCQSGVRYVYKNSWHLFESEKQPSSLGLNQRCHHFNLCLLITNVLSNSTTDDRINLKLTRSLHAFTEVKLAEHMPMVGPNLKTQQNQVEAVNFHADGLMALRIHGNLRTTSRLCSSRLLNLASRAKISRMFFQILHNGILVMLIKVQRREIDAGDGRKTQHLQSVQKTLKQQEIHQKAQNFLPLV